MKKTIFLFIIGLLTLHSCTINSEIIYHKDATSSTIMDIDVREFVAEMKTTSPDSLTKEMDKLPTTWTSMYDMDKKQGSLKTKDPDSIKVMKKIFMKSNKENNEYSGLSIKLDHFSQSELNSLDGLTKGEKLPIDQNIQNDWDGKTLTIHTENFNLKNIEEALRSKRSKQEESLPTESMVSMLFKQVGTTLKFENKIKSITGKHDWLKQIDDHSVRLEYDIKSLYDKESTFKHADKKVFITTE